MASPVDICNLSLGRLGDRGTVTSIDPADGSAQAEHCAKFYPIARDSVLEYPQTGWRFATTRATLAQHDLAPIGGWAFAYSYPADCLKPLDLLSPADTDLASGAGTAFFDLDNSALIQAAPREYSIEIDPLTGDRVIYTNIEQAILKYTMRQNDTSKWPSLVVDGVSMWLASYLAGPLVKGATGMKVAASWMDEARKVISFAAASEANSVNDNAYRHHVPDHIRVRGGFRNNDPFSSR